VDANAIDPATGYLYFGTGNSATGYNAADNAKEHVEVALKVHSRGGPDQTPTFDSHGNPTYTEAAGLQITTPDMRERTGILISVPTRRSAVATIH
jgi:hypothetical protein